VRTEDNCKIYVKHTNKIYTVGLYSWNIDWVIFKFNSEEEQDDFFSNFHKKGDLNYVAGEYKLRHEEDSYKYTILLNNQGDKYVLDVMSVDYGWLNSEESKKQLEALVSVLNTDKRPELYEQHFREIKIDNLFQK
jgi:hypothetical protein